MPEDILISVASSPQNQLNSYRFHLQMTLGFISTDRHLNSTFLGQIFHQHEGFCVKAQLWVFFFFNFHVSVENFRLRFLTWLKTLWAKTTLKLNSVQTCLRACKKPPIKKPLGSTANAGVLLLSSSPL